MPENGRHRTKGDYFSGPGLFEIWIRSLGNNKGNGKVDFNDLIHSSMVSFRGCPVEIDPCVRTTMSIRPNLLAVVSHRFNTVGFRIFALKPSTPRQSLS